jgi:hypothetical protein
MRIDASAIAPKVEISRGGPLARYAAPGLTPLISGLLGFEIPLQRT